ncbi:MAG TPA: FtsX-like permease family protein [Flavihumibacter sp.]|nr:FtsX-like permease family protein [Bacteroidota bacterium]HOA38592.1 FtsX-like permease family protein [Flavihumibacter sp.]HPZ86622.1 FtsX-like permease family protein [Flavihumibacter sp.]
MNFLFAWRYFRSKKTTNAINIIAWVSVAAVLVGTASLIVVLSVFNGFEDLVKSLYATYYTDLKIVPAEGKVLQLTDSQRRQLAGVAGVRSFSLVTEEKALMKNGEAQAIVYLKGVDSAYTKVSTIDKAVKSGSYELGDADKPLAMLGVGVENVLRLYSDREILPLTVYIPRRGAGVDLADPMQSLRAENIYTAGSLAIQQEFDNQYVITNLAFMKRLMDLSPDEFSAVEIALNKPDDAAKMQQLLQQKFGKQYKVLTRFEQNQSLYSVMQLEKWVIYCLLSLILVVAAFTMIGSLTMLVLEKQKDIQVLKALGASKKRIQAIFVSEGFLLAGVGALSGCLLALLIGWAQMRYKLVKLQGESFVIDHYPVKFMAKDFLLVLGTVVLVSFLAAWMPARKAAGEQIELKS